MAPPSPRRSSRARATNSQSHQSSASSGTSGRAERSSRAFNKTSSGNSTPSASLSSEPLEGSDDTFLGRRRRRAQDDEQDKTSRHDPTDMAHIGDDLQDEEDEAVRCLCGSEEYPGRPVVDGPDAELFAGLEITEDLVGFFVQCDICKVWQHGACAGIFSAESSPDEYFCEQCRKDLHKISVDNNGQKYSKYLPLHRQSRATSRSTSVAKERTQSPSKNGGTKNLRPTSSQTSKRRSTMNSRDAAYDDEQLRRAIEASREESAVDTTEGSVRRTKRGRSDSEEIAPSIKRQRTTSQSPSPPPAKAESPNRQESEDEDHTDIGTRNTRSQREKSEKDEKEDVRQDATTRRKTRPERRRGGEESDPSDDAPLAESRESAKKSEEPPAAAAEQAGSTTANSTPVPPSVEVAPPGTPPTPHATAGNSHKKGARSNHKRSKGKNQYTRDRDGDLDGSPARSMSRDIQRNLDEPATSSNTRGHSSSKGKTAAAQKMSMLDMKRRVGAIMDFISRTQVDLAAEGSVASSSNSTSGDASPQKTPSAQLNAEADGSMIGDDSTSADRDFKDLNCVEMMDILTRDMVKWQNQYT